MAVYGAWHQKTTHYYEDDGGGSSRFEDLIDSDSDVETLRTRCNAYFEKKADHYHNNPPLFAEGAMKSSVWSSSGGGCSAQGCIVIKELPSLS